MSPPKPPSPKLSHPSGAIIGKLHVTAQTQAPRHPREDSAEAHPRLAQGDAHPRLAQNAHPRGTADRPHPRQKIDPTPD